MLMRAMVAGVALAGLMVAGTLPAAAQQTPKNQKKSYIYYRAEDRAYFERARVARRLTVQPRSYLSAGTETKRLEEHYADYAYPPGGSWDYSNRNSAQGSFNRQPLNDPWDIPGWPKF